MDTNKIITPVNKVEVELKGYITGRDKQNIEGIMLEAADFQADENGEYKAKISGKVATLMTNKKIEAVVVSVGGETTNVLDKVLDLISEDYDFVLEEIDKIADVALDASKKKK